ncbi:hypothetical protein HDV06_002774 [Boothiomyces sp. JEL0866]|nr:hypothetical protein HDV06_002774 [Boothiomyces sp. JEL0866]
MNINKFSNAAFAIQSQWLSTYCTGPPDLIVGNTRINETVPFTPLVLTGPKICGQSWIQDCSCPGICAASLDTKITDGYQGFQDSYLYKLPDNLSDWLFPTEASGYNYCVLENDMETELILQGSPLCFRKMKCSANMTLLVYESFTCEGNYLAHGIGIVNIDGRDYNISKYEITSGSQDILWTTFIPSYSTPLKEPEPIWMLALVIGLVSVLALLTHILISVAEYAVTRRWKYLGYTIGYIFTICECVLMFLSAINGVFPTYTASPVYCLGSAFNVALNGICLMEIVFQRKYQQIIITVFLITTFMCFGFPFLFNSMFASDTTTDFGIWINYYYNSISYPVWQTFCVAFDPVTAVIIIFFVIRQTLWEVDDGVLSLVYIMFSDTKLVVLLGISIVNFVTSVFLQFATTYSFFARNDKIMVMLQMVFSLQHSINSCCTLWYNLYFPQVLVRMLAYKKSIKSKRMRQPLLLNSIPTA